MRTSTAKRIVISLAVVALAAGIPLLRQMQNDDESRSTDPFSFNADWRKGSEEGDFGTLPTLFQGDALVRFESVSDVTQRVESVGVHAIDGKLAVTDVLYLAKSRLGSLPGADPSNVPTRLADGETIGFSEILGTVFKPSALRQSEAGDIALLQFVPAADSSTMQWLVQAVFAEDDGRLTLKGEFVPPFVREFATLSEAIRERLGYATDAAWLTDYLSSIHGEDVKRELLYAVENPATVKKWEDIPVRERYLDPSSAPKDLIDRLVRIPAFVYVDPAARQDGAFVRVMTDEGFSTGFALSAGAGTLELYLPAGRSSSVELVDERTGRVSVLGRIQPETWSSRPQGGALRINITIALLKDGSSQKMLTPENVSVMTSDELARAVSANLPSGSLK